MKKWADADRKITWRHKFPVNTTTNLQSTVLSMLRTDPPPLSTYPGVADNGPTMDFLPLGPQPRHLATDPGKFPLLCQVHALSQLHMWMHTYAHEHTHAINYGTGKYAVPYCIPASRRTSTCHYESSTDPKNTEYVKQIELVSLLAG